MVNLFTRFFNRAPLLRMPIDVGQGQPVVLLHGIASSSTMWMRFLPKLSRYYRCVTVDLLGFGLSPKPKTIDYTVDDHVNALERSLSTLKLKQPVILIGHSMGAVIAARYARRNPTKVQRLLLLSCPLPFAIPDSDKKLGLPNLSDKMLKIVLENVAKSEQQTLGLVKRVRRLMPEWFDINEQNWYPFEKSLKNTVLADTVKGDIQSLDQDVEMFYGSLDQLISLDQLRSFAKSQHNVHLHRITTADHTIGQAYRAKIFKVLTANETHNEL